MASETHRPNQASTLKSIAKAVQVDISTVSRILNKKEYHRASPETCQRILEAAKKAGYRPNTAARALVQGKTNCIGLLVPDLHEPAFVHYVEILEEMLDRQGFRLIPFLSHWSEEREAKILDALPNRQVDAMISLAYSSSNEPLYDEMRSMGFPIIFREVHEPVNREKFDSVSIDVSNGGYELTKHFFERGYRKIGYVGRGYDAEEIAFGRPRHGQALGYAQAHEKFGIPMVPQRAIICEIADAYEKISWALDQQGLVDALLIQSNGRLPGAYRALQEKSLAMGRDIGVATITDSHFCFFTGTPITVWDQPIESICQGMVSLLVQRLSGQIDQPQRLEFHSRLVPRASTQKKP